MPPMMSLTSHTFWIDYESGKLLESFTSGAQAKNPTFIQGDTSKVEIHIIRRNGSVREEISLPAGSTLKMGIGRLESQPTAGSFKIGYKGTASAEIPFNASASDLQTALNGIPDVDTEGGISVETAGDAFLLTWNSGNTHDPLTSDPDELFPSSQVILVGQVVGDVQKVLLHLQQSPVAFLQSFLPMGDPILTTTLIATIGSRKVFRISIAPNPAGGSFFISGTNNNGTEVSPGISVNATSADVLNALPSTISTNASVTKSGIYSWDVSISSTNSMTVDGSGLLGWLGVEGNLSLNTVQIHEFLNAREEAPAVLEFMVSEVTGETTILQTPCTIVADLIDEGSIAPLDLTPPLSEGVANNRYVRRDTFQNPTGSDLNNIWLNLGVTKFGTDVSDSISNSDMPSAGNPLITASALASDLSGYATESWVTAKNYLTPSDLQGIATEGWVGLNFVSVGGLSAYATKANPSFSGTANFDNGNNNAITIGNTLDQDNYTRITKGSVGIQVAGQTNIVMNNLGFKSSFGSDYWSEMRTQWLRINEPGSLVQVDGNGISKNGAQIYAPLDTPSFSGNLTISLLSNKSSLSPSLLKVGETIGNPSSGFSYLDRSSLGVGVFATGQVQVLTNVTGGATPEIRINQGVAGTSDFITQIKDGKFLINPNDGNPAFEPYVSSSALDAKANLSGATFTGKVNLATIAGLQSPSLNLGGQCDGNPTNATNGDLWINNAVSPKLVYRMNNSNYSLPVLNLYNTWTGQNVFETTSSSTPAIRVTQKGTSHAIVVEDATNPDTTAFVVDASGAVGVGVDAATWTATNKVEVVGAIKATSITFNGTSQFKVNGTQAHGSGANTHDLLVSFNGSTYRIPMIFVSTP